MTTLQGSGEWGKRTYRSVSVTVAGVVIGWANQRDDGTWECRMKDRPETVHSANTLDEAQSLLILLVNGERES